MTMDGPAGPDPTSDGEGYRFDKSGTTAFEAWSISRPLQPLEVNEIALSTLHTPPRVAIARPSSEISVKSKRRLHQASSFCSTLS